MGRKHFRFGLPYTASCHLEEATGFVTALSGKEAPVADQLLARRMAKQLLGFEPHWERIKEPMSNIFSQLAGDRDYNILYSVRCKGDDIYSVTAHAHFANSEAEANQNAKEIRDAVEAWAAGKLTALGKEVPK